MNIEYIHTLDGVTPQHLQGFFVGWARPYSPQKHLQTLHGSQAVVLARDTQTGQVVGFINALHDGVAHAFIPLLEVLPAYQGQGIGTQLVQHMLERLSGFACVDLCCDPDVQPFYRRFGMMAGHSMLIRR